MRGNCVTKLTKSPIIILTTARASKAKLRRLRAWADDVKIFGRSEIDFSAALGWLRDKWKVKRLLCEGGGELNDALFRAGLVNELHLTVCPKIFGGRNAPTIADGLGFSRLADAARFQLKSSRRIGEEIFLVFERATPRD
jgi:riboflavin-specific deaminase-like protein